MSDAFEELYKASNEYPETSFDSIVGSIRRSKGLDPKVERFQVKAKQSKSPIDTVMRLPLPKSYNSPEEQKLSAYQWLTTLNSLGTNVRQFPTIFIQLLSTEFNVTKEYASSLFEQWRNSRL